LSRRRGPAIPSTRSHRRRTSWLLKARGHGSGPIRWWLTRRRGSVGRRVSWHDSLAGSRLRNGPRNTRLSLAHRRKQEGRRRRD